MSPKATLLNIPSKYAVRERDVCEITFTPYWYFHAIEPASRPYVAQKKVQCVAPNNNLAYWDKGDELHGGPMPTEQSDYRKVIEHAEQSG